MKIHLKMYTDLSDEIRQRKRATEQKRAQCSATATVARHATRGACSDRKYCVHHGVPTARRVGCLWAYSPGGKRVSNVCNVCNVCNVYFV